MIPPQQRNKCKGVARRQVSKGSIPVPWVGPKSTLSKIASESNFHSGEKEDAKVHNKGEEETAIRSSKDVDNSESEKWHDASLWSVGSTALGRGLQMTHGRPGYQVFISNHLSRRGVRRVSVMGIRNLFFPEVSTRYQPTQPCSHEFVGA